VGESVSKYERKHRKQALRLRTPDWLTEENRQQMNLLKRSTPPGYSVDHIVPLRGVTVSGLHVPWNLQHMELSENCSKNNCWTSDNEWTRQELLDVFSRVPKGQEKRLIDE